MMTAIEAKQKAQTQKRDNEQKVFISAIQGAVMDGDMAVNVPLFHNILKTTLDALAQAGYQVTQQTRDMHGVVYKVSWENAKEGGQ